MSNQESGKIKQMKLRIPMQMYAQLEVYAASKGEKPATTARHILGDALIGIPVNPNRLKELIEKNWQIINKSKRAPKAAK